MMRYYLKLTTSIILGVCIVCILNGCGSVDESKVEAQKIVFKLFECIKNNEYEKTTELYADGFFWKFTKEDWPNIMKKNMETVGSLKETELKAWNVAKVTSKGTRVDLEYEILYSNIKMNEKFTVIKRNGWSEYKILNHVGKALGRVK